MSPRAIFSDDAKLSQFHTALTTPRHRPPIDARQELSAAVTRAASKQTYYTIRWLADQEQVLNAYRAYAYFRWVDDQLDLELSDPAERATFVERQQALVSQCYGAQRIAARSPEEQMLADLIMADPRPDTGLHSYLQNMMDVMRFDVSRRGRLVSQQELDCYTRMLATGVTEALHYFIGANQFSPHDDTRYLAVTGAHITHMLRDTLEDTAAGYFNIPVDYLQARGITAQEVASAPYREWVCHRVQLARSCFAAGRDYLARVENLRCRLAGYAYIARFEWVLDMIEQDSFCVRPAYPRSISLKNGLAAAGTLLSLLVKDLI